METIKKYYRIERKEICFLKFIFEAYDGIAMLTTVDPDSSRYNYTSNDTALCSAAEEPFIHCYITRAEVSPFLRRLFVGPRVLL